MWLLPSHHRPALLLLPADLLLPLDLLKVPPSPLRSLPSSLTLQSRQDLDLHLAQNLHPHDPNPLDLLQRRYPARTLLTNSPYNQPRKILQ